MAKKPKAPKKLTIAPMTGAQATLLWQFLISREYGDDAKAIAVLQGAVQFSQSWEDLPSLEDYQLENHPENLEGVADFLQAWADGLRSIKDETLAKIERRRAKRKTPKWKSAMSDDDDDEDEPEEDESKDEQLSLPVS